ncbi:hypothetical protein AVEN_82095-1 [Araneus ventricosus]|uniref:Uncharacterized protein n=1 Tax=Araneus ventricosus TaxID=182803 RepID=A0A4Y2J6F9_ARAVE|nr:hypothetical protein AVEN_82095-1 [Araneus ventricosus]
MVSTSGELTSSLGIRCHTGPMPGKSCLNFGSDVGEMSPGCCGVEGTGIPSAFIGESMEPDTEQLDMGELACGHATTRLGEV